MSHMKEIKHQSIQIISREKYGYQMEKMIILYIAV